MKSHNAHPPTDAEDSAAATARAVLVGSVQIVHRCGFTDIIETTVRQAVADLPRQPPAPAKRFSGAVRGQEREMPKAPHAVTVWTNDPRYVNEKGEPLPLPRRGRAPSVEALIRSVDRRLDTEETLQYLIATGSVKFHEGKYWVVSRAVIVRDVPGPRNFRALRCVDAMQSNAIHNSVPESEAPGWLERMAENENFPVSELPKFATFLEQETMAYLDRIDAYARSAEIARKVGEPTVRLRVGMYLCQEESAAAEPPTNSKRKKVRRSRVRRST